MNICSVVIDRASSPLLGPLQSSQKKKIVSLNQIAHSGRLFVPLDMRRILYRSIIIKSPTVLVQVSKETADR